MSVVSSRTLRVPVKQLRRSCDPRQFKFKTTKELAPLDGTVGQARRGTTRESSRSASLTSPTSLRSSRTTAASALR